MAKAPKKNVSSTLHDVKWPKKSAEPVISSSVPRPTPAPYKRTSWMWPMTTLAAIALLMGGFIVFGANREYIAETPRENFSATVKDAWTRGVKTFINLKTFSANTFGLIDDISAIQAMIPDLLKGERGDEFISELKEARKRIEVLSTEAEELHRSGGEKFLPLGGGNPITIGSNLGRANDFLLKFIPWLEGDKRVVVLFQNPSELRPSGGFLGSFAELTVSRGAVKDIKVYDINEIDKDLGIKLAPPEPIKALSSRWYTRDANWFFGFPDSAETVAKFMESSGAFKNDNKKVDAVISVSGKVLQDILKITGPIDIEGEKITLNSENFLKEIQKDIQESREEKAAQPKRILKEAMPLMLSRLGDLDGRERKELLNSAKEWGTEKDVMIYMRDRDLQKFFESIELSGSTYSLPKNFVGDYLAVVSSNMASGKSDIVIRRNIKLVSQIDSDGTVRNELTIKREHRGNKENAWWYKTTNESYFKVFTPLSSRLDNLSGAVKKEKVKTTTLEKDSLVNKIEATTEKLLAIPEAKTFEEYGKKVFGFWSRLNSGETKEIKLEYSHKLFVAPAANQKYTFVFEKQSGTQGQYDFQFIAPVGFVWRENNSPVYEYETNDPPGRLNLVLTLDKEL